MKIQTVTHKTARRNGKPLKTYKIRYEEVVRDPATGQPVMTPEGSSQKRSRSETYPTYDAADARRREIESERAATGAVTGREARLEPFAVFANAWFDSLAGGVKARTLAEYRRIYKTYVAPQFGARAVGAISPADARRFRADLVGRGLARGTTKHAFDVFRRILDLAVVDGAIPTNPAAVLPRNRPTGDAEPFAPHPLTPEQVAAVAGHIGASYPVYGLVVLFLAYSGLRAAELAGLEIGDLRLGPAPSIVVRRTKRKVKGGWETGTPKSRKSRRTVPLDAWLADDLRAYLQLHPHAGDPSAPLFPARYGRNAPGVSRSALTASPDAPAPLDSYNWAVPLEPGTFYSNYFRSALAAVGLPASAPATEDSPAVHGVRLHDLRHSFAVISLSAGAHYMQVSKWLGHESYVTTLTIYAEGGKAVPLARPTAPAKPADKVVQFRRRVTG